ncbi:hypothetical protein ILUMI_09924, partial [Ignelater luminosus]
ETTCTKRMEPPWNTAIVGKETIGGTCSRNGTEAKIITNNNNRPSPQPRPDSTHSSNIQHIQSTHTMYYRNRDKQQCFLPGHKSHSQRKQ